MLRLMLALFLGLSIAPSAYGQSRKEVTVGVLAFRGSEAAQTRWQPMIDRLATEIPGHHFRLIPLSLDSSAAALEAGQLHFLLTNPGHYESHARRYSLAPVVSLHTDGDDALAGAPRTGNRYGAVIFTRDKDDTPRRLSELRGKHFGAVAPEAFGGWQLARHALLRNGIEPERDFARLHFFGFPQSGIVRAVQDGRLDAGTVRTGVLEAMEDAGMVSKGELRVLNALAVPGFDLALSTVLVPEWLLAATPRADDELRSAVSVALLTAQDEIRWTSPAALAPVWEVREALALADNRAAQGAVRRWIAPVSAVLGLAILVMTLFLLYRRGTGSTPQEVALRPEVHLTRREQEILDLIARGHTTKEIARDLAIAPKTVEFHRHNLLRKFEASNVADLVHRANVSIPTN